MPEWLSVPRLVDVILLGMAVEAGWLFWRHRRLGKPIEVSRAGGDDPESGASLLVATRLALRSADPALIAAALDVAGITHAIDVVREMPRGTSQSRDKSTN